MSLLTKVVKSSAVVDDRPPPPTGDAAAPLPTATVIKRGAAALPEMPRWNARSQQSYVDELNRVRVEIAQAKAELRTVRRELEEAQEDIAAAQAILNVDGENADMKKEELKGQRELARQEAEQIIENARAEAVVIRENAQNDGFLEGFSKGFEDAKAEYMAENGPAVQQLRQILEALDDYQHRLVEESESGLVDLAIGAARRVLGREVTTDPIVVADMLYEVLDTNRREEFIKISIAKDLMPVEAKASEEVRALLMRMNANVQLLTDIDLEPGGCVVETPKGYTDVSISTQLNNLSASLKES